MDERVLMLIQNSGYPGDTRVLHEASALVDRGYRVSVICPGEWQSVRKSREPWHEVLDGVSVYRFPQFCHGVHQAGYIWEYAYSLTVMLVLSVVVLFREGFDIIHAANPPDLLVLIAAPYKLIGKQFIYDHHDLAPDMYIARFGASSGFLLALLRSFETLSCRLADHILATNRSYKMTDVDRSGVPPERISIVRNGPVLETFLLTEPDPKLRVRARYIIAYAGVMGVQDGVDRLLDALAYLVHTMGWSDFCCVLIGDGDAYTALRALTVKLRLEPYVWFAGWTPEPLYSRYLSTADLCVCPDPPNLYNDRSTMIKIMEYMALGKPIVAFDLAETRFSAQESALYVKDEVEFAHALAFLMNNPEKRAAMGKFGRRRIETQLAWRYSVEPLVKAYDRVGAARRQGWLYAQKRRVSRLRDWSKRRNPRYMVSRMTSIVRRYGLGSAVAKKRATDCVNTLKRYGCRPTFAVPGRVVAHHGTFCRQLQDMGAELALHGYDHVDFRALERAEADRQILLAKQAFRAAGIRFTGIRCPYLSGTPELHRSLPPDLQYTSNSSVWWDELIGDTVRATRQAEFDALFRFYRPKASSTSFAIPRIIDGKLDIPASLPDDIQLCDGLQLSPEEITKTWLQMLQRTHRRGEVFVVLFHPELFERCASSFTAMLDECMAFQPPVWVAPLRDISDWWWERSRFKVSISEDRRTLRFQASARATILLRNVENHATSREWDGKWRQLEARELTLNGNSSLPFISLGPSVGSGVRAYLREEGYVITEGEHYGSALHLDELLTNSLTEIELAEYIETSSAPLVRFWRWPDRLRSALCITGDLDALSLRDYASRIFAA